MTALRPELPPLPVHMQHLPVDKRGYPVPYFVADVNGEPDFRIMDPKKLVTCVKDRRCWLCGEALGKFIVFVVGPMCVVNRISSEPPSHRDCADFAARACPFLARPDMRRREIDGAIAKDEPAGFMIGRNPGVTCLYVTRDYTLTRPFAGGHGVLFQLGDIETTMFYAEGRQATIAEIVESIVTGIPALVEACLEDSDPAESIVSLAAHVGRAADALGLQAYKERFADAILSYKAEARKATRALRKAFDTHDL